jgi:hypothetical protein
MTGKLSGFCNLINIQSFLKFIIQKFDMNYFGMQPSTRFSPEYLDLYVDYIRTNRGY